MKTHNLYLATLFFNTGLLLAMQASPPASAFLDPQEQNAQKASHEDELYGSADKALSGGDYEQAINGFSEVARMRGRRADAALYWKAYALNKAARRQEALATLRELRREYGRSRWLHDARVLQGEIGGFSGEEADPNANPDDDVKMLALNSIMQTDPEKAIPILEKVLQGNSSLNVKERALFVLAQAKSDKAHEMLLSVAKGSNYPELQARAIKWLAVAGGARNSQTLQEIYAASTNPEVKSTVLKSFIISGDKDAVFKIAQQEKTPELKYDAIKQLGVMGARAELRQLYKTASDAETKETLLKSMNIAGDLDSLIEVAKTEKDPDVRVRAVKGLAITGGQNAVDALVTVYNSDPDLDTRRQVIRSLFIHGAAKEMVALARKETNPELKKELVRNLSIMHSPEATDYMLELLK